MYIEHLFEYCSKMHFIVDVRPFLTFHVNTMKVIVKKIQLSILTHRVQTLAKETKTPLPMLKYKLFHQVEFPY